MFDTMSEAWDSMQAHLTADHKAHPSLRPYVDYPTYLQGFIKEKYDYRPSRSPKRQKVAEPTTLPSNDEQKDKCEIYIGNIDHAGASIGALGDLAEEYGIIYKIRILYEDPCKIYAFVLFSKRSSVLRAVECLHGELFYGRKLCACIAA